MADIKNFKEVKDGKVDEDLFVDDNGKAIPKIGNPFKKIKEAKDEHPAIFAGIGLGVMTLLLFIVYCLGKNAAVSEEIFEPEKPEIEGPDPENDQTALIEDTTPDETEEDTLVFPATEETTETVE